MSALLENVNASALNFLHLELPACDSKTLRHTKSGLVKR